MQPYIRIVCTNVLSFFNPTVSSGSDFPSLAVEISVKSTGLQFCHALVLLNGRCTKLRWFSISAHIHLQSEPLQSESHCQETVRDMVALGRAHEQTPAL